MTVTINGTTGITNVDGSAATPAVQGTDTNTGIFFPAADAVGISTGGTEKVRVASAGQIGIGGANYGTSGQVLTSGGAAAAPSWASGTPSGAIMPYAGSTSPTDWLLCSGGAVSRTTYAALFAIIGTTYGIGDGSTTFNLPDLRGRSAFGVDDMGGTAANRITSAQSGIVGTTLGATGGVESITLTTAQLPSHTHPNGSTNNTTSLGLGGTSNNRAGYAANTGASGSGSTHSNTPPAIMLNYIIKT
jgi:microcystin-dependent protein